MMKQIKTLFFLLLALALVLSLGVCVAAEGGDEPPAVVASGECGQSGGNAVFTLYSDGMLVIEGANLVGKIARDHTGPLGEYDDLIKDVVFGEGITGLESFAFNNCLNLETVTLPKTFFYGDCQGFNYCPNLKRFIVDEKSEYHTVDENGCLFSKDMTKIFRFPPGSALTEYSIPDSVTEIGSRAFYYCRKLEKVSVPDSVTAMDFAAFSGCLHLKEARIPPGVTYFGWAVFNSCNELQQITIPEHFTEIPGQAFAGCHALTSVNIPKSVTKIGENAFYNCYALQAIDLHDGITEIGESAFACCHSLQSVKLPKNITEIPAGAFRHTKELKQIELPAGIRFIGERAFGSDPVANLEPMTDVYIRMSEATWNSQVTVADYNERLMDATLHFLPDETQWIALPYGDKGLNDGDKGLNDGDWYLDMDAFMDAIGRGKSDEEKAEVRALIEQHVVFSYNPGGNQCVYRYAFTDLPGEDGTPVNGEIILPLDLTLGNDDAFPYDYEALKNCVKQYHAPDSPDQPEEEGSWFEEHIVKPLKSAIATILSFFRRLFGKRR